MSAIDVWLASQHMLKSAQHWRLLKKLSEQSVEKRADAYRDIDWDATENAVFNEDGADPRFRLPDSEPLGGSSWYKRQPVEAQRLLGLFMVASQMRIGQHFESVLKRGLVEYINTCPDGSPEARYAYHEIIEEGQHALIFQEFVKRTGLAIELPALLTTPFGQWASALTGRYAHALFFLGTLAGEEPIDWAQRRVLDKCTYDRGEQGGSMRYSGVHPLIERICRIHTMEEARHIAFAYSCLEQIVPVLPSWQRTLLGLIAPQIVRKLAFVMLTPTPQIIRTYEIPQEVLDETAFGYALLVSRSTFKLRERCIKLGIWGG